MRVGVVGLGKLGLPTAAWLASKGHQVLGFDVNEKIARDVLAGGCPYNEPGLAGLLPEVVGNITLEFAKSIDEIGKWCDVAMIIVPTPSTPDAPEFSNAYVVEALKNLCGGIKSRDEACCASSRVITIVVVSTVMPGSCMEFSHLLEYELGPKGGRWDLVYSPEFIALGSILHDLEHAFFYLVGCDNEDAARTMTKLYGDEGRMQVLPTIEAELAKLCLNVGVTFKISYANLVGMVCRRYGADPRRVLEAIGHDERIGPRYLRASRLGFGGPCFPRDVRALGSVVPDVERHMTQLDVNDDLLLEMVEELADVQRVAILGITYKPGTPVLDESQALALARSLHGAPGRTLTWWDPIVQEVEGLPPRSESVRDAVRDAQVVVVALPGIDVGGVPTREGTRFIECW